MARKPWRTVQVGEDAGRFTRQQIIDAVEAVKARKEAKASGRRNTSNGEIMITWVAKHPVGH